jgi:uncharacterized protein YecE (DUF72 family)
MILVGTSGFSFADWKGTVYPKNIKNEEMLSFYEKELGFNTLEINFTYYALPSQKSIRGMCVKTSRDFKFAVKAFKGLTHGIWDDEKKITDNKETIDKFKHSLEPMVQEGKLICVIAQFPYSFHPVKENIEYLETLKNRFGNIPVVIEFRNIKWLNKNTFDLLKKIDLGYCVVDEPKLPGLMPFYPEATSGIAYFRLHGRNMNWFNAPAEVRYDYNYSDKELKEFLPEIQKISLINKTTLIFFNNCHAGSAAKNAITMAKMLL